MICSIYCRFQPIVFRFSRDSTPGYVDTMYPTPRSAEPPRKEVDMTRRIRLALVGLTGSLAIFVVLASAQPVQADLTCDDLALCSSSAGCGGPGDPIGCDIFCTGGAHIECPPIR